LKYKQLGYFKFFILNTTPLATSNPSYKNVAVCMQVDITKG